MEQPRWTRRAGIVAALAGVALLLYAPFHAAAYLNTPDGSADASPTAVAWSAAMRDALPFAFDFAAPRDVYVTYGRILGPILTGFALGVAALHARQKDRLTPRHRRWSYLAVQIGSIGVAAGALVEYYTPYLDQAFLIGAPFLLLSLVGYFAYGLGTRKAGVLPAWNAWLLIMGPVAAPVLVALFGHIPIALSVIAIAWIAAGARLARGAVSG